MSKSFDKAIVLDLGYSRVLLVLLLLAHSIALVIVAVLDMAGIWSPLLYLLITLSLWRESRAHVWRNSPSAIRQILWHTNDTLELQRCDGDIQRYCSVASWFVLPRLVVITVACRRHRAKINIVISADAVDDDSLRQMRVRLNMKMQQKEQLGR